LSGTMDSPDQNAMGMPLSFVQFKDGELIVKMDAMNIVYTGKPNKDYTLLEGTFTQMGRNFEMNMSREAIAKEVVKHPQEPKDFPYYQEEVSYENPTAGNKLAGTLTLPKKEGQYPVVILISGSGAQDRNEALLGHKPFLVLSDYLTRQGIAVLRFDDRGVGGSTGNHATATTADFATDVLAGIEYLKSRKEIKHNQIGLMGHSEGGLIAPMVAAQSKDVAFIVSLAGPGIDGGKILAMQTELISLAEGEDKNKIKKNVKSLEKMIDIIKNTADINDTENKLKKYLAEVYDNLPDEDKKEIGDKAPFIDKQIKAMNSPWMRFFLRYDPADAWSKVSCPVLALNGSKDLQVPPKENLAAIEKLLKAAGNTNVTTKELPGLNHLFQHTKTGAISEYGKLEETFSTEAMKVIADWLLKVTK
ncbi:MAG TPA: alpha/beta fold hydrolase, partial [Saprospiraceae bacterium]|nr:alpha/beta fold hydrolase [Saprospiraceae bacterium]